MLHDARGMNPVVGIILLVAIVVAMAAVIYTMAGALAPPDAQPAASFQPHPGGDRFFFKHLGSESLDVDVTRFQIIVDGERSNSWVSDMDGNYARGDPGRWDAGETVCVSCGYSGKTITEATLLHRDHVMRVWTGNYVVP